MACLKMLKIHSKMQPSLFFDLQFGIAWPFFYLKKICKSCNAIDGIRCIPFNHCHVTLMITPITLNSGLCETENNSILWIVKYIQSKFQREEKTEPFRVSINNGMNHSKWYHYCCCYCCINNTMWIICWVLGSWENENEFYSLNAIFIEW